MGLCIARRINQSVYVYHHGVEIKITVIEMRGKQVHLNFDAPPEVTIRRDNAHQMDFPIVASDDCPEDEIRMFKDGKCVGRIVNFDKVRK